MRFLVVLFLCLTAGCQTAGPLAWCSPEGSARAEALAGLRAAAALEDCHGGVSRDAAAERRMERIAQRLVMALSEPATPCRCRLLDCRQINAYSLPGGLIYVTRGLYERLTSDGCLAAVLAHELAHLDAKDSLKPRCTSMSDKLEHEVRADCQGARCHAAAGYRTESFVEVLRIIEDALPDGWCQARIDAVTRHMALPVNSLARASATP